MTVVAAYVGRTMINPCDNSSGLHSVVSLLLIEGIAQNTMGNVIVPEVGAAFFVMIVTFFLILCLGLFDSLFPDS